MQLHALSSLDTPSHTLCCACLALCLQKGGLHTWAAARFATGRRGLHTARFVTRAYPQVRGCAWKLAARQLPGPAGGGSVWAAFAWTACRVGTAHDVLRTQSLPPSLCCRGCQRQGQEGGEPGEVASSPAAQREELAGLKVAGGSSPTGKDGCCCLHRPSRQRLC